jgi:hypothetical protein
MRFASIAILVLAPSLAPAGEELVARVAECRKIWDQAPHNAFTDLTRFQDRWYCVFREGTAHVSPDGAVRVISSDDACAWESAAQITSPTADLRDPKLAIGPSGQLAVYAGAALHNPGEYTHQSMAWFSSDGKTWSDPVSIGEPGIWIWRVVWNKDAALAFGYSKSKGVRLYRSDDGKRFETVVETAFTEGYPNETSLVFNAAGDCWCLLRRDEGAKSAQLGFSKPSYTEWTWKDLGTRIGGPHMIRVPQAEAGASVSTATAAVAGELRAVVRLYNDTRTVLCRIDPETGALSELVTLPSGGDTSYAGLVWHDDRLWVSYYSSHEGKASIYLAQVAVERVRDKPVESKDRP